VRVPLPCNVSPTQTCAAICVSIEARDALTKSLEAVLSTSKVQRQTITTNADGLAYDLLVSSRPLVRSCIDANVVLRFVLRRCINV
jgi:hypothetical protein